MRLSVPPRPDLDLLRDDSLEEELRILAKISSPAGRSELDGLGPVRRQTPTAAGGYRVSADEGATEMTPSPSPEDRLDDLLLERRRELDAQVARLVETVTGLERREELVRDSRASVERVLRMGATDLDLRESELADRITEVAAREERLQAGEEELAQRTQRARRRRAEARGDRAARASARRAGDARSRNARRRSPSRRAPGPT